MRRGAVVIAAVLALGCGGGGVAPREVLGVLRDGRGNELGRVTLRERGERVLIRVRASGLAPGLHGVHLHASPRCEGPGFQSAGGHHNPDDHRHGRLNPQGPHLGDLGNLTVERNGRADQTFEPAGPSARLGLKALLGAQGLALVIHEGRDDEQTDPSGNSGARIACAVLLP